MSGGPIYPDVPDVAGVPPVRRLASDTTATEPELKSDSITVQGIVRGQWGIYTSDNKLAIEVDSVSAIGFSGEHRIADFPIEQGKFESYDKVALPYQARVVVTKGGTQDERNRFLAYLEDIRVDRELYHVVTPEFTYLDVNVARVNIDRSREQGANLITAEIVLQEIRQTAKATVSASKPSAADPASIGPVQAAAPTDAEKAVVTAKSAKTANPVFVPGQKLMKVPLVPSLPAQKLSVQLAGKAVAITLLQKSTGLFASVAMNGAPIVTNVLCRDAARLINGGYLGFPGDLGFFDLQGKSDPDYIGLGQRFTLMWASL